MKLIINHYTKNVENLNPKIDFLFYSNYKAQVRQYLQNCPKRDIEFFKEHYKSLLQVYLLDLDPLLSRLSPLYSTDLRGNPPIDPSRILRSLFLMTAFGKKSPRSWALALKLNPILAVFSGFQPGIVPSYGTYYTFEAP